MKIIAIMLLTGHKKHSGLKSLDTIGIAKKKLSVLLKQPSKPKDEISEVIAQTIQEAN